MDNAEGTCEKNLNYNANFRNDPNCLLFSNDKQHCNVCKSKHYFSMNHCCPEEQFWNITTKQC